MADKHAGGRIVAERDVGTPVMIVSTELDEVIDLADRIAVLYKGKIVGIVPSGTGRDVLGLMMAGIPQEDAAVTGPAVETSHTAKTDAAATEGRATSSPEGGEHA